MADDAFDRLVANKLLHFKAGKEAKRMLDSESGVYIPIPEGVRLDTLLNKRLVAQPWCIEGLLPEGGRALLAAQNKAGKTTITGNLVKSLVDGVPFLGRFKVNPPGNVTVLDFEMTEAQLQTWYRDIKAENTSRVMVRSLRGSAATFDLRSPERRAEWAAVLRADKTDFVIFDCLRPVLDAVGLDEHKDCGLILTWFDTLLKDAGVKSAVVVHHAGHANERSRGDSRLRDWPDAEWIVVRENSKENSPRYFRAFGRDVNVEEGRLNYNPRDRRLTFQSGVNREKAQVEKAVNDAWNYLGDAAEPPSTTKLLDELITRGASKRVADRALKQGEKAGRLIVSNGKKGTAKLWKRGLTINDIPDDEFIKGD